MKFRKKIFVAFISFCCFVFSTMFNIFADTEYSNDLVTYNYSAKIEDSVYEYANNIDPISVYIWCKDINQDAVESEVENRIGFSKNEVYDLDYSQSNSKEVYQKVNNYINSRRLVSKEMYQLKMNSIIEACNIEGNIIFKSKYAPMLIAELTIDEIELVSNNSEVLKIGLHNSEEESLVLNEEEPKMSTRELISFYNFAEYSLEEFSQFMNSMRIRAIKYQSGLSGKNVKIGMLEDSAFENHEIYLPSNRCFAVGRTTGWDCILHANRVATIMAGDEGISSGATVYAYDYAGHTGENNYFNRIEQLLDLGVKVINLSMGMFTDDIGTYISEIWTNHVILNHNVTIVGAAGNNGRTTGEISYPLNADNVITVGACDNMGSTDKFDDVMRVYSSYFEQNSCIKPDIVAYDNVFENESGNGGTSYSSPVVTGTIALMLECKPSLALHPEVIKSIIMASCQHKAIPYGDDPQETMAQGITDKQGAGVFDPYLALCITANGNYGYGEFSGDNDSELVKFSQSPYDATGMNISLAWLKNSYYDEYEFVETDRRNLDLSLSINDLFVSETTNTSSSIEMIYSNINTTRNFDSEINYKININYKKDETYDANEKIRYGYAWCSNSEEYNKLEEFEGIYFIKNASLDSYLSMNPDTGEMSLRTYIGHYDNYAQLFIVTRNKLSGGYAISGAFSHNDGITAIGNKLVNSTNPADITITKDERGRYIISCDSKYLSYNRYLQSDEKLLWEDVESISDAQSWVFEKVNYRFGDINMDGIINEHDILYVTNYKTGTLTPDNVGEFLADVNFDGVIDDYDVYAVFEKYQN